MISLRMMFIEDLPDEILYEIFEYIDTHYIIRAFSRLNIHFERLLRFHIQSHHLNLESLSRDEYGYIFENFLLSSRNQIPSLRLSNDETPGQPESFVSEDYILNRFIHLKSLSLFNIHSIDTLNRITYQCLSLQNLTHLKISNHYQNKIYTDISYLLNNIWSLENLTHCQLNGIQHLNKDGLLDLSKVSLSIKYLSIEHILSDLISLSHLFKHTPSLRQFHGIVHSYSQTDQFDIDMSSIKSLKLSFGGSFESVKKLLRTCSNLISLNIDVSCVYFNGDQWKYLIINYLPNLKTFHLRMIFNMILYNYKIDQIFDSFRNDFWIKEHQWFAHCLWNPSDPNKLIILYTLPYTFDCLNSDDIFIPRDSISHLHIQLPRHDISKMNSSMLYSLKILDVSIHNPSSYSQLQLLFDQTPNLYSLKIIFAMNLIDYIFTLTSTSIQRLDLVEQSIHFTKSDCLRLIESPLGRQCQVLLICLSNRSSILDLIQHMNHLRSLVIQCNDNDSSNLMQWLKEHLSSNDCIVQDSKKQNQIHIWIDRKVKRTFSYRQRLVQYFRSFFFWLNFYYF